MPGQGLRQRLEALNRGPLPAPSARPEVAAASDPHPRLPRSLKVNVAQPAEKSPAASAKADERWKIKLNYFIEIHIVFLLVTLPEKLFGP